MIDFHCHILPNWDDGAGSPEESLEMAQQLSDKGFACVVATPHFMDDLKEGELDKLQQQVEELNRDCQREGIPLEVVPGSEILYSPLLMSVLEGKFLPTVNQGEYLLLELSLSQSFPSSLSNEIFMLRTRRYQPVLAHPERNGCFLKEPHRLYTLAHYGLLYQVNLCSFTGDFGRRSRDLALKMLRSGLISFVGTDAHVPGEARIEKVGEALQVIEEEAGKEVVKELLKENPARALRGESIEQVDVTPYFDEGKRSTSFNPFQFMKKLLYKKRVRRLL